ncbi:hypothetical protein FQA39_LY02558 [Lamprigera yunnana]|nr:hypothetical protein FQA39_LY02558 [Lamprigera yunnana]
MSLVGQSVGNIQILPKNILLTINETVIVSAIIRNSTTIPCKITFIVDEPSVAKLDPHFHIFKNAVEVKNITIRGIGEGRTEVTTSSEQNMDLKISDFTINVCRIKNLDWVSKICGWIFILSWGSSFYPQLYINFRRKSVIGLNFDYLALNLVGYLSFSAYILSLFFNSEIQGEYWKEHPLGLIPVKLNDVVYNLHGMWAILLTIFQCSVYERGNQKVSTTVKTVIYFIATVYGILTVLQKYSILRRLDVLYACSYVKLAITLLKYIPQAYMNFKRKSTTGWSIQLVFLDLNGGIFSTLQMVLDSYNYNDWNSLLGNLTKFILVLAISRGDIQISTQQLLIGLNRNQTVSVTVTDFNNTDVKLQFVVQHVDIIRIQPTSIILEPQNKTYEFVIEAKSAGHSEVTTVVNGSYVDLSNIYIVADVCKSRILDILSKICGWIYIISWGCAFYPQIYSNYKRKSVIGLNFDYLALNLIGYLSFGIFISGLFFISDLQRLYHDRYPRGLIPVKTNDVVYNIHGTFAIIITIIQCFIYEKGEQKISTTAKSILGILGLFCITGCTLLGFHKLELLDFLYYCSYIKLLITVLKYIPQAYMNYKRKSTDGWSIGVVFLDLIGGVFSILQMILDSYNYSKFVMIGSRYLETRQNLF